MGYDTNVIQAASLRLEERRTLRQTEYQTRRAEIYRKIPRTAEIEQELRATTADAAASALRCGENPSRAIAELRDRNLALQREREQLLLSNGYSAGALLDTPVCPLCGDSGWIGAKMCSCLRELCSEEQILQLSSLLDLQGQSFDSFRLDLYSDQPYEGHGEMSPRENMALVFSLCKSFANQFPNFPYFKNMLLSGGPGLGKTFLSASIAQVVTARGYSVVYDSAVNVFAQFEARKFNWNPDSEERSRRVLLCDLLILDDLGTEMRTSFTHSALYDIVNSRLVAGRSTIISTNLSLAQIQKIYTPQVCSRISGSYRSLAFYGDDIRLRDKNRV